MDEIKEAKIRYAHQIEDGRKIEVFTNIPEYQWYVENVVKPTIEEYTERILSGKIASDKEDWVLRGMIQGMKLMIETPENFKHTGQQAKKQAKKLAKYQKAMDDEREI